MGKCLTPITVQLTGKLQHLLVTSDIFCPMTEIETVELLGAGMEQHQTALLEVKSKM